MEIESSITAIDGVSVGHATDLRGVTGCTVVLCNEPMVGGVDVRGSAPGTRETDLLRPMNLVQHVDAILLAGGSAYGLDAASGVMRFLEDRGKGYDVGVTTVPIVPAAILMDLHVGDFRARPDAQMGHEACLNAKRTGVERGSVGAGTGATVGKMCGMERAMKGGVGMSCVEAKGGIRVAAIVAVNALGDVRDPDTGQIVAGARTEDGTGFEDTIARMKEGRSDTDLALRNTTIGVVATNVGLTKEGTNKVAQMAHDGLARVISPVHTMYDGDTIFALSKGGSNRQADISVVGTLAAEAVALATLDAVKSASTLAGFPAWVDIVAR